MDSDVDTDVPVRLMSSQYKAPLKESVNHTVLDNVHVKPRSATSPLSIHSTKSIKESLDVTEIRRILQKLKAELEDEKKKNKDVAANHTKDLEKLKQHLSEKHNNHVTKVNEYWKKKLDDSANENENVVNSLNQKINELLDNHPNSQINSIICIKESLSKIEHCLNLLCSSSHDPSTLEKLANLINDLRSIVQRMHLKRDQDEAEMKIEKLKNHNAELTQLVRMLDKRLKASQSEIDALSLKIKDSESKTQLEELLRRSTAERLLLEKQITWLKNSNDSDPATRERVELLTTQLNFLQEKCNQVEKLKQDITQLLILNEKLTTELGEKSSVEKTVESLQKALASSQSGERDKLEIVNNLESLNKEYKERIGSMEKLLKKNEPILQDENSEESMENLKAKLRELEKRCTQQALNYEEALLELEALKKTSQRQTVDILRKNGSNQGISPFPIDTMKFTNFDQARERNDDKSQSFNRDKHDSSNLSDTNNNESKEDKSVPMDGKFATDGDQYTKSVKLKKHIPPPTQIRVESHPSQKGIKLIRWKPPEQKNDSDKCLLTAYHIYFDGHFYKVVGVNEPMNTTLPQFDSRQSHRVSIRSVCVYGQSKDAQCTIEFGATTLAPSQLKADKITSDTAQLSWLPSNSNWCHSVSLNGERYCDCQSGVYKLLLEGLSPNSLQRVKVHPVMDRFSDDSLNCAYLDFHTLPAYLPECTEIKKPIDEIEPPKDVKLKLGSRPGRFVVKWMCPPTPPSNHIKIIGYSLLISNQCIGLVNGAKSDRFSVNLSDLRSISPAIPQKPIQFNEQPYLPLTLKTVATYIPSGESNDHMEFTIYSRDSYPVLRFSGHVAARIAGTAAEASMMLGSPLATFLNLTESGFDDTDDSRSPVKRSRTPKYSKEYAHAKISVPKIQITKDSSFSEEDEGLSLKIYRNRNRNVQQQYEEKFGNIIPQQPPESSIRTIPNNPNINQNKIPKHYPQDNRERVPKNQWSTEKVNNPNQIYDENDKGDGNISYFVALYDYDPATMSPNPDAVHEELPFRAGQVIKVFGQVDEDGFYTGETNGRRGLVPSNMVTECDNRIKFKPMESFDSQQYERNFDTARNKDSREYQPKMMNDPRSEISQMPYKYETRQMPFQRSNTGNAAAFPQYPERNTFQQQPPPPPPPLQQQQQQPQQQPPPQNQNYSSRQPSANRPIAAAPKKMIALYDYDPQSLSPNVDSDAELAFKANDIITIIGEIDEDGFYHGELRGQRGLVPSNFLAESNSNNIPRQKTPPDYQRSFDSIQNQFKERNFSASSNYSDPPPIRDNRPKGKMYESELVNVGRHPMPNEEFIRERSLQVDHQKIITQNSSFEDSFDSGPQSRLYSNVPDSKHASHRGSTDSRGHTNEPVAMANEVMSSNNQTPLRNNRPVDNRRNSQEKVNQQVMKLQQRQQSSPPPLETDDMPIVMDLAPSKDNQKKKKASPGLDPYRSNMSENADSCGGHSENAYLNSNDNLERKRSVFKNPFKKKKS